MTDLLKSIKKTLNEEFKSDDKVSSVPDVKFVKKDVDDDVDLDWETQNRDTDNVSEIKKKETKGLNKYSREKEMKPGAKLAEEEELDEDSDLEEGKSWKDNDETYSKKNKFNTRKSARKQKRYDPEEDEAPVLTKEELDLSEDVKEMLASEELSEETREKIKTVFEAAVLFVANKAVAEVAQGLKEQYLAREEELQEQFDELKEEFESDLEESVNDYLMLVVEDWKKENEVALQHTAKTAIAESFMEGLKSLLETHYIEMPEEKEDIFESVISDKEELEEELEAAYAERIELINENKELRKALILKENVSDLSEAQAEKLKLLSEGVDFDNEEKFEKQITAIKESFFKDKKITRSVEAEDDTLNNHLFEEVKVNNAAPEVAAVEAAIRKLKI